MKPWEETWCRGFRQTGNMALDGHLVSRVDGVGTVLYGGIEEDARLAAAAPEAMRLLLALEWSANEIVGYDGETEKCCPSCRGLQPEAVDPRPVGHTEDCALVALLQKAGVRGTEE